MGSAQMLSVSLIPLFVWATLATKSSRLPSIVLVLTDDQDVEFGGLTPMRRTLSLLGEAGVTGRHYYVNTPVCCPSRSQILTGRFGHNLRDDTYEPFPPGTLGCGDEPVESPNVGSCGCMRMNCSQAFERQTYANYLQRAGYKTAYFGKYLNPPAMVRYCRNETLGPLLNDWPSGWDIFYGMCDQASTPEGGYYEMNWINSETGFIEFTGKEPTNYTTSLVGNKTVNYLRQQGELRRRLGVEQTLPFFVAAAVRAPHAPFLPPPWYKDAFPEAAIERVGSYNISTEGKPQWLSENGPISQKEAGNFDRDFANRWRCLLAVDDLVNAVVETLAAEGLLDSTYIFFTSDNGFHFGHFRLPPAKQHVYEFDVRVPFLVRGPGVRVNVTLNNLIGNVDLAPTFLDIARIDLTTADMDGRSLLPLLHASDVEASDTETATPWRTAYPIEHFSIQNWLPESHRGKIRINDSPNNTYRALRIVNTTHDLLYSETTTVSDWWFDEPYFHELYDMRMDPNQLDNILPRTARYLQEDLQRHLLELWSCSGESCSKAPGASLLGSAALEEWV